MKHVSEMYLMSEQSDQLVTEMVEIPVAILYTTLCSGWPLLIIKGRSCVQPRNKEESTADNFI